MNWNNTYQNIVLLEGKTLQSISGRSNIYILEVTPDHIILESNSGQRVRPMSELKRIVQRMELLGPVHVDSVLMGSGSSRNQPETILVNLPDVEWMTLNSRKHIIWAGKHTHSLGTVKLLDSTTTSQVQQRFRGKGAITGTSVTANLLLLGSDTREASKMVEALFQIPRLEPITNGIGYHASGEFGEVYLIPDVTNDKGLEVIPIARVVDKEEAVERLKRDCPGVTVQEYDVGKVLTVVRIADSTAIAIL